jgi:hypothetical protein
MHGRRAQCGSVLLEQYLSPANKSSMVKKKKKLTLTNQLSMPPMPASPTRPTRNTDDYVAMPASGASPDTASASGTA